MSDARSFHDEEALGKAYDSRLMRRLLKYMRPYRMLVVAAVLMILLAAVMQISLAKVTQWAIDDYISAGRLEGFPVVGLVYLVAIFGILFFTWGQIMTTVKLGQNVQHDLQIGRAHV